MFSISDKNLHLALVDSLMREGLLPKFDKVKFWKEMTGKKYDDTAEYNYERSKEVEEHLLSLPIETEQLVKLKNFAWDTSDTTVIHAIFPFWNGEDDYFDIKNLKGIEQCTNLEAISITVASNIDDISSLKEIKNLQKLLLYGLWGGESIRLDPLKELSKLKEIKLWGAINNLSPLAELTSLQLLKLKWKSKNIFSKQSLNVKCLSQLSSLRELEVENYWQIKDVDQLAALQKINVSLDGQMELSLPPAVKYLRASAPLKNFDSLKNISSLEELDIAGPLISLKGIVQASKLKKFKLSYQELGDIPRSRHSGTPGSDMNELAQLNQLQELSLFIFPLEGLEKLPVVPQLQALSFYPSPMRKIDLHIFQKFPNLRELSVEGAITSLEGVEVLTAMEVLTIKQASEFYTPSADRTIPFNHSEPISLLPLKNLKKLRVLKLPNFKQVENQDVLNELPVLENQDVLDVSPLLVKSSDLDQGRRVEQ